MAYGAVNDRYLENRHRQVRRRVRVDRLKDEGAEASLTLPAGPAGPSQPGLLHDVYMTFTCNESIPEYSAREKKGVSPVLSRDQIRLFFAGRMQVRTSYTQTVVLLLVRLLPTNVGAPHHSVMPPRYPSSRNHVTQGSWPQVTRASSSRPDFEARTHSHDCSLRWPRAARRTHRAAYEAKNGHFQSSRTPTPRGVEGPDRKWPEAAGS